MADVTGVEPATSRSTGGCSTVELHIQCPIRGETLLLQDQQRKKAAISGDLCKEPTCGVYDQRSPAFAATVRTQSPQGDIPPVAASHHVGHRVHGGIYVRGHFRRQQVSSNNFEHHVLPIFDAKEALEPPRLRAISTARNADVWCRSSKPVRRLEGLGTEPTEGPCPADHAFGRRSMV